MVTSLRPPVRLGTQGLLEMVRRYEATKAIGEQVDDEMIGKARAALVVGLVELLQVIGRETSQGATSLAPGQPGGPSTVRVLVPDLLANLLLAGLEVAPHKIGGATALAEGAGRLPLVGLFKLASATHVSDPIERGHLVGAVAGGGWSAGAA
jgi:hypothetical protein